MKIKAVTIKTISSFMCMVIILTNPFVSQKSYAQIQNSISLLDRLNIPLVYGSVSEGFRGDTDKIIIHIQDAHGNYEAQKNEIGIIKNILDGDNRRHFGFLAVEGAQGNVDTGLLTSIKDLKTRNNIADYFLRNGLIKGSEFFVSCENPALALYGAEDAELYFSDLGLFNKAYENKKAALRRISRIDNFISRLKPVIFSPLLLRIIQMEEGYLENKISFVEFSGLIRDEAAGHRISLDGFTNLKRLMRAVEIEDKIDYKGLQSEREGLIKETERLLTKEERCQMVKKSLYFRLERISGWEYYGWLKDSAIDKGINLKAYPQLSLYIRLLQIQKKIDYSGLFKEIILLTEKIKDRLFTKEKERELDRYIRHLRILRNLFKLELTRSDLAYYLDNREEILKTDRELSGYAVPFEDFYKGAVKRDRAIIENTINELDRTRASGCILITGGFHTEGIKELLKEKGISYIVITPRLSKIDNDSNYNSILLGEKTALDVLLQRAGNRIDAMSAFPNGLTSRIRDRDIQFLLGEGLAQRLRQKYPALRLARDKMAAIYEKAKTAKWDRKGGKEEAAVYIEVEGRYYRFILNRDRNDKDRLSIVDVKEVGEDVLLDSKEGMPEETVTSERLHTIEDIVKFLKEQIHMLMHKEFIPPPSLHPHTKSVGVGVKGVFESFPRSPILRGKVGGFDEDPISEEKVRAIVALGRGRIDIGDIRLIIEVEKVKRVTGMDGYIVKAGIKIRPEIEVLAEEKVKSLIDEGHLAFMAEQLVKKQVETAQRAYLIARNALDHELYLIKFIEAMADLDRTAGFFRISQDELLRIMSGEMEEMMRHRHRQPVLYPHDILSGYRAFVEMVRNADERIRGKMNRLYGRMPDEEITIDNYKGFLKGNIVVFNSKRPDLGKRIDELIKTRDNNYLKEEALRWLNYFLYSTGYSNDFYNGLQRLVSHLGIGIEGLIGLREKRLSDSERNMAEKIKLKGRITYSEFMETALYDTEYGFYTRERDGAIPTSRMDGKGEFITLPEEYSDFGKGIAYDIFSKWQGMGKPQGFQIVEMGAGGGAMAYNILDTIYNMAQKEEEWQVFFEAMEYRIVEISRNLIAQQRKKLDRYSEKIEWIEGSALDIPNVFGENSVTGVFLSNELPDAFPAHKVKYQDDRLYEVYVTERDGVFIEELGEPSTDGLKRFIEENGIRLEEGEARVINLSAVRWLEGLDKVLKEGYIMTFDYGYSAQMSRASLLTRPQFRKYGRERSREELQYHGLGETSGNLLFDQFVVLTSLASEQSGTEETIEMLAGALREPGGLERILKGGLHDIIAERLGIEPFRDMQTVLEDYIANPLPNSGNVDITTDCDFPVLNLHAGRLGMKEDSFSTQGDYFKGKEGCPELCTESPAYKVQVFYKGKDAKSKKVTNEYEALFARGTIDTAEDVRVLFRFLKEEDILGLKKMVAGIEEHARISFPLVGISGDCLIRIGHGSIDRRRIELDEKFYKRIGLQGNVEITPGESIENFINRLVRIVPADLLTGKYYQYAAGIPGLDINKPFTDFYNDVYERLLAEDVLSEFLALDLALAMEKKGFSVYTKGVPLELKRRLFSGGIGGFEKAMDKAEPIRTRNQLRALRLSIDILLNKGGIEISSIGFKDILIIEETKEGIRYRLNRNALRGFIERYWEDVTGKGIMDFLSEIGLSSIIDSARGFFSEREMGVEGLIRFKEELLARLISVIGRYIDKKRGIGEAVAALGERELPVSAGKPERIRDEPADSRNLISVISRYMEYVEYLRRTDPGKGAEGEFLNLVRLLPADKDIPYLRDFVSEFKGYNTWKTESIRILYEAGFRDKARGLLRGFEPYNWDDELIGFLCEKGEDELVQSYLEQRREGFKPDSRGYFRTRYEAISPSLVKGLPEEADKFFIEEWAHIKNLVRIYLLGREKTMGFVDEISAWWVQKRGVVKLNSAGFDIFNIQHSQVNPEKEMMQTVMDFIERGLKEPKLFEAALDIIGEFSPSPMLLRFYQTASENIPGDWDTDRIVGFFNKWMDVLGSVGSQLEKEDYFEPYDKYLYWNRFINRDGIEGWKGFLPSSYRETRLFHKNISYMIDCIGRLIDKGKDREGLTEIGDNLIAQLGYEKKLVFNYGITLKGIDNDEHDPLFYSLKSFASIWLRWVRRYGRFSKERFRDIIDNMVYPDREEFKYFYFPIDAHRGINSSYLRVLRDFVESVKELYGVGLLNGIYDMEFFNRFIPELLRLEKAGAFGDTERDEIQGLQAYWTIQLDIQKILANGRDIREIFSGLHSRIKEDRRGFFRPELIARGAGDLSSRSKFSEYSVTLFKESIERLRIERGKADWQSEEVVRCIHGSSLSDSDKDEVYLFLLQRLWPRNGCSIVDYYNMRDDVSEAGRLSRSILKEKRFPKSTSYLIERLKDGVKGLDPKRYGRDISLKYQAELEALSYMTGYFTDRRELLEPGNFSDILALYSSEEEGLGELGIIFPEEVKKKKGNGTELPDKSEIENGEFEPDRLRETIIPLLNPEKPEDVWQEAVNALGSWLRYDLLNELGKKKKRIKRIDERAGRYLSYTYIEEGDLSSYESFSIAKRFLEGILKKDRLSPFEDALLRSILDANTKEEAFSKGFIYYEIIRDTNIVRDIRIRAFEELTKSGIITDYTKTVFSRCLKGKGHLDIDEFLELVTLWDHRTRPEDRLDTIWPYLFEEKEKSKRDSLIERLRLYLRDREAWIPDLGKKEDWWILLSRYGSGVFNNFMAGAVYQGELRKWSLKERIIFLLAPREDSDRDMYSYFVENWNRLDEITVKELYTAIAKDRISKEEKIRLFKEIREEKKRFLAFKDLIEKGKWPKESRVPMAVIELLRIRDKVKPDEPLDLKKLLRLRFPQLNNEQIDELYKIAENPFRIEGDTKKWQEILGKVAGSSLNKEEKDSLYYIMYPFLDYIYHRLLNRFPYELPKEGIVADRNRPAPETTSFLLDVLKRHGIDELEEIGKNLAMYARVYLVRGHQRELSVIKLPEALQGHDELAIFLFKVYFKELAIGEKEELIDRLKDLGKEDALHQFFIIRDLVKIAQLLANRPEVPLDYRKLLRDTFDKVKPSDRDEVRMTIARTVKDWGWRDFKLIRLLNAGSMGEVWLVQHKDYKVPLAVKVLTPSKKEKIDRMVVELEKIKEILNWYTDIMDEAFVAIQILDQLLDLINNETDYKKDLENWKVLFCYKDKEKWYEKVLERLIRLFGGEEGSTIRIRGSNLWTVEYYKAAGHVLVMSYVDGVNPGDIKNPKIRKKIVKGLWDYLRRVIFEDPSGSGRFPIDLHLGNILIERESGRIVLIDTGQMGQFTDYKRQRGLIISLLTAISQREPDVIADTLEKMSKKREDKPYDRAGLVEFVKGLSSGPERSEFEIIRDLFVKSPSFGLVTERVFMDLLKGFMVFQGTASDLAPGFKFLGHEVKVRHPRGEGEIADYIRLIERVYPEEAVRRIEKLLKMGDISVSVSIEDKRAEVKAEPEYRELRECLEEAIVRLLNRDNFLSHPLSSGDYKIRITAERDSLGDIRFLPHKSQDEWELSPLAFLNSTLLQYAIRHEIDHALDTAGKDEAESEGYVRQNDRLFFRSLELDEQLTLLWHLSGKNPNSVDVGQDGKDVYPELEKVFAERYGLQQGEDLWRFIKAYGNGFIDLDKTVFSEGEVLRFTFRDYFYSSPNNALSIWNSFYDSSNNGMEALNRMIDDNGEEIIERIASEVNSSSDLVGIDLEPLAERIRKRESVDKGLAVNKLRKIALSASLFSSHTDKGAVDSAFDISNWKGKDVIPILIDAEAITEVILERLQSVIDGLEEGVGLYIIVADKDKREISCDFEKRIRKGSQVSFFYEANVTDIKGDREFAEYLEYRLRTDERYRPIRLEDILLIATPENFKDIYQFLNVGLKLVGNVFSRMDRIAVVLSLEEYTVLREVLTPGILRNFEKEGGHYIFRADPIVLQDSEYLGELIAAQKEIAAQA